MSTLIIQSLAWALLHSIWQIALIAGLLYVLLNRISGRMAAHRYLLSFGALTLSFLAALLTFSAYFFAPSAAVYAVPGDLATVFDLPVEALAAYQLGKPMGLLETIEMWVQTNSGWIALAWSVGILALSLYYAVGLIWSKLIRHYRTKHLDTAHFQQWQQIYSLSGMRKYIEIKQSFLVKGPLTVGHVKPIILVPIGFFTMLSPSQVEAILLHELAHIRRHDYLFNLVQVFIKLVLFYHPATWFICRCIDTEREHACDDLAMSSFADPKAYVRALGLLRIQFFNQKNQWAMHFYQQEPAFLARLKRLANPTAHSTSKRKTGTLIVPICLIVLGGVFVSFKEQAPQAAILPDFGIEGPVSIDQMQMDTIIPEEEVEEIVEKPSATQFPIVVEEEPPVIVEGTPSEKGNQVKELFKLQYQIAQQKRELEAAQSQIYLDYVQGNLSKEEKEKAISELQLAYEKVDQERANLFEQQRELNSKLSEEEREQFQGLYFDGEEVYRFNDDGVLQLKGTARFPDGRRSNPLILGQGTLRITEGLASTDREILRLREDQRSFAEEQRRLAELQFQKAQAQHRLAEIKAQEKALQNRLKAEENRAMIRATQDERIAEMRAQAEATRDNQRLYVEGFSALRKNKESFPVRLKKQLIADGLAKDNDKKVKVKIKDGEIYINKRQLSGNLKTKYQLFFQAEDLDMDAQHDIEIRTNGFKKSSSKTAEH